MSNRISIQIKNFDSNKRNENTFIETEGLIIKRKKKSYIVTSHNFLPIKNDITLEKNDLKICINSKWNELLILKTENNIDSLPTFTKIRTKLPSVGSYALLKDKQVMIQEFVFHNFAFLPNYPQILYIRIKIKSPSEYIAGTPLYDKYNGLLGIVSFSDNDSVYCLPSYYIIKTFEKKNKILLPNVVDKIVRVNRHLVKDNNIYNPYLGTSVPLFCYFLLESNRENNLTILKDKKEDNITNVEFREYKNNKLINNSRKLHIKNNYYDLNTTSLHLLKKVFPLLSQKLLSQLNDIEDISNLRFKFKRDNLLLKSN